MELHSSVAQSGAGRFASVMARTLGSPASPSPMDVEEESALTAVTEERMEEASATCLH